MTTFFVSGEPIPKQSFRYKTGGGYQPKRVTDWKDTVGWAAKEYMSGLPPTENRLRVELKFLRSTKRRVDLDNLSKNVLDAMQGIVFRDDAQIMSLCISKEYVGKDEAGVWITVEND